MNRYPIYYLTCSSIPFDDFYRAESPFEGVYVEITRWYTKIRKKNLSPPWELKERYFNQSTLGNLGGLALSIHEAQRYKITMNLGVQRILVRVNIWEKMRT
jgi:hypothetical protein